MAKMDYKGRASARSLAIGTIASLALVACGSPVAEGESGVEPANNSAKSSAVSGVWDFPAATVDGRPFDSSIVEKRPVVAWFWTPWCTVCRAEAGDVAAIAEEFEGKVTFVGVAGLGDVADMQEFVSSTGISGFPHLEDDDGSIWAKFGVVSQPSFAFVDASGEVEVFGGALGPEELRLRTQRILG